MGALLHKDLHRSRAWNRFPIPTKVHFSFSEAQDDVSLAPLLIEQENQTAEYTRISSHPAYFYLSEKVKEGLCIFLADQETFSISGSQSVRMYLR